METFIRTPYNYDTMEASNESGLECKDKSKAIQSQKEESDINTIVKRFGLTGELPSNVRMPEYGDYTSVTDYHTAMSAVKEADSAFAQMPAEVRNRFHNNPEEFVEFCLDENNREEAEKLGLVLKKELANEGAVPATDSPAGSGSLATPAPAPAT
ncbi:MAG: internal scaffolding protein [Microvirus sp.]|nr:MAG: internal scaffolding protein [Microvirus sp.]